MYSLDKNCNTHTHTKLASLFVTPLSSEPFLKSSSNFTESWSLLCMCTQWNSWCSWCIITLTHHMLGIRYIWRTVCAIIHLRGKQGSRINNIQKVSQSTLESWLKNNKNIIYLHVHTYIQSGVHVATPDTIYKLCKHVCVDSCQEQIHCPHSITKHTSYS